MQPAGSCQLHLGDKFSQFVQKQRKSSAEPMSCQYNEAAPQKVQPTLCFSAREDGLEVIQLRCMATISADEEFLRQNKLLPTSIIDSIGPASY